MKIFLLTMLMFYATHSKRLGKSISNNKDNNLFRLFDNSKRITELPKFVFLPNFKTHNESFEIQYKSFRKTTTIISQASSNWILSVYVDQHFSYSNQSNEPLHALCFLEFSIENISNEVGQNASCKIILRLHNFTATANCSLKIGRPPSTCSAHFELSETILLSNRAPTWATISAEVTLPSSPSVTTAINRPSFLFNSFKPVNWTVIQSDEKFGKFGLGLPISSVRIRSKFKIPFSITKIDRLNSVKILMEYNDCFSFIGLENVNSSRWEIENSFYQMDSKQSGFIRVTSLDKNYRVDEEFYKQSKWKEIGLLEFIVNENPSKDVCWIRAGISKIEVAHGATKKYFDKNNFQDIQTPIPVSVDLINIIMIVFPEPRVAPLKLYSALGSVKPISNHVYTYLLHKAGDLYFPQLIQNLTCHSKEFLIGIARDQCSPIKFLDSWVLPVEIEHWRTVVFNMFNFWRPESWKIYLSDTELNPISSWNVFRNNACAVLYQSAVLKIGTRVTNFNSFGMRTYLGATLEDPKPWIDVSKETDISSLITSRPSGVVSLSRNNRGTILVDVKSNQRAVISLVDRRNNLLTDTEISVFSEHWASVVKIFGRCLSQVDIHKTESHPNGEGQFNNYQLISKKLELGEKCRLYLGIVFNDNSEMLLEDMAPEDYRLKVDGIDFRNGDFVHFQPQMNIALYGSPMCQRVDPVRTGSIDLSSDWLIKKEVHNKIPRTPKVVVTTETMSANLKTEKPSEAFIESRNSLSIAIYCIVGIVAMAIVILLLNCLIGLNVRRNSTAHMQRRLSKSGNFDRQNNNRTDYLNSQKPLQDHYPPLLPPPGPIIPPSKPIVDWAVSSESGIGLERSSLGSQQDPLALSTFRISMANGSMHPSDSSSYIHRTSPFNDIILESNAPLYNMEPPPQQIDSQTCSNRPFWPRINSPYRVSNLDSSQDFRSTHDSSTLSSENRKKLDIV